MRSSAPKLVRVAQRLAAMIDPEQCAVVGALAVAAHGHPRATTDVDLVSRLPLAEVKRRLADGGVTSVLKRGDVLAGECDSVQGVLDGIEFDVLPPLVPIDWSHVVEVPLGRRDTLRVVNLPTLVHLKLRAGGPQDVVDVVMLLQRHPGEVERARELATAYGVAAQLDAFMKSPRLQAKAPRVSRRRGRRSRG